MIKNRFNILLIIAALLIIASLGVQLHYMKYGVAAFQTRLILLLLLNLSFIDLITLMFFVSKALV
jgi:hypothetical protein